MGKPHFLSQRMDWKTPKAVYQVLDAEFSFDHDPCPPNFTVDGLTSEWGGVELCKPTLRQRVAKVDRKRLSRVAEGQDSCVSYT